MGRMAGRLQEEGLGPHTTRAAIWVLVVLGCCLVSACGSPKPTGQVLAVVNGQEVTRQDIEAEQRASSAHADPSVLLQTVVSRTLLAQAAHAHRLDSYPGFPSDIGRLRSTFLADKFVQSTIKPASAPAPADVQSVIASNPYAFARRQHIKLDAIKVAASDAASVDGTTSLSEADARLKSLNVQFQHAQQAFDTAVLPAALAQELVDAPLGQMIRIKAGRSLLLATVEERQPAPETPAEANALATNYLVRSSNQKQVLAQVQALARAAKIEYQPGFAPTSTPQPRGSSVRPTG